MKKIFLIAIIVALVLFVHQKANAQNTSPFWSLKGNNNATNSSILGTTNNTNLNFFTNNLQRIIISGANGEVGIGTISPTDRLHINSGANENALRAAVNGIPKFVVHSNGGVSVGSGSKPPANGLFVSGFTGIGTATPGAKLHIVLGSSGFAGTPANISLLAENSTNNYISVVAPGANERGILFSSPQSLVDGGVIYNNSSTPEGLQFRTNFNITQMVLTSSGNVGIGTTSPDFYKTKISLTNSDFGLDLENTDNAIDWELFPDNGLDLFFKGTAVGVFDGESGAYTSLSDERLKTNIKPMPSVLDNIDQLKPSSYQFKNSTDKKQYNGFIARDVSKVFPDLVVHSINKAHNVDLYSLNYSGFGVIAIKGIQELQVLIDSQKKINEAKAAIIQALEERITKLETTVNKSSAQNNQQAATGFDDALLGQNNPNPFNQSTTIHYHLPKGSKGQINIYNEPGNLVKTFIADDTGLIYFNNKNLNEGTYTYSLILNGKTSASKKMIIIK